MRRTVLLLFFSFVILTFGLGKVYTFSGDSDYPPFEYKDEHARAVGFNVDILSAISRALGLEVRIALESWFNARDSLESGSVDGLLGMYYSKERESTVDFSAPYLILHGNIFTRVEEGKARSLEDLEGKSVAVQRGDIMEDFAIKEGLGVELVRVENPETALIMLSAGQVDALLLGSIQGLYLIDRLNLKNIVMSDNPFVKLEYGFAVTQGDRALVGLLNEGLTLINLSGEYRRIYDKWFAGYLSEANFSDRFIERILPWVLVASISLLGFYLWNLILRRRIKEKTSSLERELNHTKEVEAELAASVNRYRAMSEVVSDYFYEIEFDTDGEIENIWKSDTFEKITGYEPSEINGFDDWEKLIHPSDLSLYKNHMSKVKNGESERTEYRIYRKNGVLRWIREHSKPVAGENGELRWVYGAAQDITEEKLAKLELETTKEKVAKLHDVALKMGKSTGEAGIYHSIIDASKNILGLDKFGLYIVYERELLLLESKGDISAIEDYMFSRGILKNAIDDGQIKFIDKATIKKSLPDHENSLLIVPMKKIGGLISCHDKPIKQEEIKLVETLMAHAIEAIHRIRSDREIHYISFHDSLTGLYNRSFFEEELIRLNVKRQLPISVIMADVDGLKVVNDAFGHFEGDRLLKIFADTLKNTLRSEDIIARWGGDEFVILLPQTESESANMLVERVKSALSKIEDFHLPISASFGVSTKIKLETDFKEILVQAEERMYKEKLFNGAAVRNITIKLLERSLFDKRFESRERTEKIKALAKEFGKHIGLSASQLDNLLLLGALHDIGEIAIPEEILTKVGSLTAEEWKKIKSHPEAGYRIALSSPELAPIAEDILSHHEWWDGSSYPRGLKGKSIPILARIISIITAFDAMTNGRPYKKPLAPQEALRELKICSGKQFDPELVETFIEFVADLSF